jgi:RNA polymerase sigma-70 factor (ECF subfamily)
LDENKAIQRLKQGDLGGLETLVRLYQVEAVRTVYGIVREQAQAEDVVQAAFVRLAERIHSYDDHRPFAPWFFRVAARDALMALRQEEHAIALDVSDLIDSEWLECIAAATPSPETFLEQAETGDAVWAALDALSPEQRAVIILRYYSDLKYVEIAQHLSLPPGTVRWRLHAALRRLHGWFLQRGWKFHQDGVIDARQENTQ